MALRTQVPASIRPVTTPAEDPVLMSKIIRLALPGWVVGRPRIDKLITQGARGPLTILTGPPGAGKTMALASWAAGVAGPGRVAWITLDRYDNRPKVFWSYVVAALRRSGIAVPRVVPGPARDAVDHDFLLHLASVLAAQDAPVVLVLDDFHLVTEPAILDGVGYVLGYARPALHLVISSRMDPLLPLHRYRLAGELTEIRASDLAFSMPESGLLLSHHDISMSPAAVQRLTERTEGWAAGLRLAALSLDGHPDPEQFVKELEAEDSAVTSYLVDEVLNAQPATVRNLLLRTSILDSVSTDLATELTRRPARRRHAERTGPGQRLRAATGARLVPLSLAVRRRAAAQAAQRLPGPAARPAPAGGPLVPAARGGWPKRCSMRPRPGLAAGGRDHPRRAGHRPAHRAAPRSLAGRSVPPDAPAPGPGPAAAAAHDGRAGTGRRRPGPVRLVTGRGRDRAGPGCRPGGAAQPAGRGADPAGLGPADR